MAESMQMTDHDDIKPFIDKILQESTRLGNRIDEVLQVAKDTEIKEGSTGYRNITPRSV